MARRATRDHSSNSCGTGRCAATRSTASYAPHEARHTCASYLAAAGLTPKECQQAMGHADIRTTLNIYAKAVPGWESGGAGEARRVPGGEGSVG